MRFIDPHCHLFSEYYTEQEIECLVLEAQRNNVEKIVVPGCSEKDSLESIKVSKRHSGVFSAVGIHPSEAFNAKVVNFMDKINFRDVIAVGEIGLDFHWQNNPSFQNQKAVFTRQLHYALKHNKPVIVHMREAERETYEILSSGEFKNLKFVLHSFTGKKEWVHPFLQLGAYFSFSGIVTFKNAQETQEIAKNVPLNRLMAETDTPYLTPTPFRGKPNKPLYVVNIVNYLGEIRSENKVVVANCIYKNTSNFFNI